MNAVIAGTGRSRKWDPGYQSAKRILHKSIISAKTISPYAIEERFAEYRMEHPGADGHRAEPEAGNRDSPASGGEIPETEIIKGNVHNRRLPLVYRTARGPSM